jgi:hypothetical protein
MYERAGGYNGSWPYAADYELAARLCKIGDYVHTDDPLFYGRVQPAASSQTDPRKLEDVPDWFRIPESVFQPRPVLSRSWRRYQQISGMLTARYMTQVSLEYARGHNEYASGLTKILLREGNFLVGVPLLPVHMAMRALRRITKPHLKETRPPEAWMGPPRPRPRPGSKGGASSTNTSE